MIRNWRSRSLPTAALILRSIFVSPLRSICYAAVLKQSRLTTQSKPAKLFSANLFTKTYKDAPRLFTWEQDDISCEAREIKQVLEISYIPSSSRQILFPSWNQFDTNLMTIGVILIASEIKNLKINPCISLIYLRYCNLKLQFINHIMSFFWVFIP